MNRRVRVLCQLFAGVLTFTLSAPLHSQTTVRVASGLSSPLFVTAPSTDPDRLFILEQGAGGSATIKILNLSTGIVNTTPFLTITGLATGGEQGLLGMAFDPGYASNGKFYVNVTAPGGTFSNGITQIRQYTALTPDSADATFFTTVLSLQQPQTNHNGGWIGFSPRPGDTNNLYIATGDGGNGNDQGTGHIEPGGNAQNTNVLLGKMLRIRIDPVAGTYTNPPTNPFGNEVFAFGLRNPFRASFDRATGDLFIGDVGQGAREEVDRQQNLNGGENFGWRLREGTIQTPGGVGGARPTGNVEPILDYDRSVGTTVTGGYVYRGSRVPSLQGKYIFADFGSGRIFTTNPDGSGGRQDVTTLFDPAGALTITSPSSFGEDAAGELYIVDYSDGEVYRIIPEPGAASLLGFFLLSLLARGRGRIRGGSRRICSDPMTYPGLCSHPHRP